MKELHDLLYYGKRLLDDLGVRYWLDCGTLLGLVRNNDLIAWETDIDISVLKSEISHSDLLHIEDKVRKDGYLINIFSHCITIQAGSFILDIKTLEKDGSFLTERKIMPRNVVSSALLFMAECLLNDFDITRMGKNKFNKIVIRVIKIGTKFVPRSFRSFLGNVLKNCAEKYLARDISESVPAKYFSSSCNIDYLDHTYRIPIKAQEYLRYRYGDNWRTPDRGWVTERDDGAYLQNKNTPA